MKQLFIILFFLLSTSLFAQSRSDVEKLLQARGMSLSQLEAQGGTLLFGENTGHGRNIKFSNVQILLTRREAVLRHEIEGVSFNGIQTLSNIESIRFGGQYILKSDVVGAIYKE